MRQFATPQDFEQIVGPVLVQRGSLDDHVHVQHSLGLVRMLTRQPSSVGEATDIIDYR
jgi:hypothetical protein